MIYLVISDAYIAPKVSQPGSGIWSVCLVEAGLWVISACVSPFGSESSIYKGAAVDAVMLWTRQKEGCHFDIRRLYLCRMYAWGSERVKYMYLHVVNEKILPDAYMASS